MKTISEETILNQDETGNEMTLKKEENVEIQNSTVESNESKKGCGWSVITVSGLTGIMLGSASTLFANEIKSDEETHVSDNSSTGQHVDIVFATNVNDEMSFNEAFAAARHVVGAGGAFVWHGNVYGTFYADEWSQMTLEDQQLFTANTLNTPHQVPVYTAQARPSVTHESQSHNDSHVAETHNTETHSTEPPVVNTHATATSSTSSHAATAPVSKPHNEGEDVEIEVLGVEENVALEDGTVVNIGYAEVDGHTAIFIDGDNDIQFERVVIDVNDNLKIDRQDITYEVSDTNLNVNTFNEALNAPLQATEDLYAQMPDYTNDANVTDLA